MNKLSIGCAIIFSLLVSGCTVRVADLTVGSTKNVNLNSGQLVKGERVTGEDSYGVFLFPFGIPNVKTAMDRAIETNKCAVGLTDVVVTQLNHSFIIGTIGLRVEGDLLIDQSKEGCKKSI
ncbi:MULTISPECIES: hypothetical protein [Shewanella]|uniref:Lipoprotein n=2 Tax=Unclassified Bacteria TaxID=49928 RepID=A0AAU6VV42_UNCXX|nr:MULTISPECIES: hypothetical protein [Shewanella]MBC8794340.1 hypothetical protein [Shewanella algae]MBO2553537.1 hypothetical protein [Shewanella algae]MBO2566254.1 hypothetical protein [Shewanella algae]MBO2579057.1 hypothetical protein [Shewanella algae]MBO2591996.1 hypothetical protein [Shewanella algae]